MSNEGTVIAHDRGAFWLPGMDVLGDWGLRLFLTVALTAQDPKIYFLESGKDGHSNKK